jgi:hypothetical protein
MGLGFMPTRRSRMKLGLLSYRKRLEPGSIQGLGSRRLGKHPALGILRRSTSSGPSNG